jgi:pimeloyl-ACP methyl ester carboxylesterase
MTTDAEPAIGIPGTSSHFLEPAGPAEKGRLRYLTGGSGAPLVLLHTVRTQAERFRNLPSLIAARARYAEVIAPVHLVYGEKDWSRPSDRQANRLQSPDAQFTQVPGAGHFIALEGPDVPADLLNAVA